MGLADYIRQLIEALAEAEIESAIRLRRIVADRSAVISVDDESVLVRFDADRLHVETLAQGAPTPRIDGMGGTDRQTVLALLAGRIEVTGAIRTGRLRIRGAIDSVVRMSQAIEILIDVAVRAPRLQALARAYRVDPAYDPLAPEPRSDTVRRHAEQLEAERAMLDRLGLLPDRFWPRGK
jgi:hypothetical protein